MRVSGAGSDMRVEGMSSMFEQYLTSAMGRAESTYRNERVRRGIKEVRESRRRRRLQRSLDEWN